MGTFAEGHLPYVVDLAEDADLRRRIPSLAVMTRAALDRLGHEERFILQVEGGRVDHACHNCDAASAFHEQIAFDEAIEVCLEFQRRQPGTLIVLTTDHGNGNPGLDGIGGGYGASSALFKNLTRVRASFGVILDRLKGAGSAEDVKRVIGAATGYEVPDHKAGMFLETVERNREVLFDVMGSASGQLGQLLATHIGVGWTGGVHTSDYVPVLAVGPGAERFRGFIQCTDVFRHYVELAGIGFRNPSVPLTAAVEERVHPETEEKVHSYLEIGSMKAGQAA
jgi:alkaline phosphatase